MKNGQIEHRGIVECILPRAVVVSVVQETACAACVAATLCHSAEKKEKKIEVPCTDSGSYRVGQEVTIVGSVGLGLWAIVWAYVVPLVLLMAALMITHDATGSEGLAALMALLSLVPYYILLYMLRNRLQRRFTFSLQPRTT